VLTLQGLTRYLVFFVIELKTRRVEIAGIAHQPDGEWMMQVERNLLDVAEGFLLRKRYLILDRDPLYTGAFRRLLRDAQDLQLSDAQARPSVPQATGSQTGS